MALYPVRLVVGGSPVRWLASPGDQLDWLSPLLVLEESDGVLTEVSTPRCGRLLRFCVELSEYRPAGTVVAYLDVPCEQPVAVQVLGRAAPSSGVISGPKKQSALPAYLPQSDLFRGLLQYRGLDVPSLNLSNSRHTIYGWQYQVDLLKHMPDFLHGQGIRVTGADLSRFMLWRLQSASLEEIQRDLQAFERRPARLRKVV